MMCLLFGEIFVDRSVASCVSTLICTIKLYNFQGISSRNSSWDYPVQGSFAEL
jgi:hypothetical protein